MNYKNKIFLPLLLLAFSTNAQIATVELKGTIILSEGQGKSYGLKDNPRYNMIADDLIYDPSLSFIARQISDSSFLRVDIKKNSVTHEILPGSSFIFRNGSSPVQLVMKRSYGMRSTSGSTHDSILYYNFKERKMTGAVALKIEENKDYYKYRSESGGIIAAYGDNGLYTAEFLKEKKASFFYSFPLLKTSNANGTEEIQNLEDYIPNSWQTIDMNTPDPVFTLEIPSTQTFPTGTSLSTDINNDYIFLAGQYWNRTTKTWYKVKDNESRIITNSQLIPGGKILYATKIITETKKGRDYTTKILRYDLVSGRVEKEWIPEDKKEYEVFFSQDHYAVLYDKYPDKSHYSPRLFDMQTGTIVAEIPLPALLEKGMDGKKIKLKGSMAEIHVNNNIQYKIKDILFSDDKKHFVITCFLDLKGSNESLALMVNGKPHRYNEFIYVFEIK